MTARGNGSAAIYSDDGDRDMFTSTLERTITRFDWHCLTYCLMGNHFHLLLRTPQPNLSRGMQQLKSSYAQTYNRRHDRIGHLFAGRFSAVLVQRGAHLLEVFRYIALNPVRAGLCGSPSEWRWSGHPAIAGEVPAPPWHDAQEARAAFASPSRSGARSYREFVADAPDRHYVARGVVYGDDDFARAVLPPTRPSNEIARRDWTAGRPPLAELLEEDDGGESIAIAYRSYGYRLSDIADHLGRHLSTISRRLRAYEAQSLDLKI